MYGNAVGVSNIEALLMVGTTPKGLAAFRARPLSNERLGVKFILAEAEQIDAYYSAKRDRRQACVVSS